MQSVEKISNSDEPATMQSQQATPGSKPTKRELPGINAPLFKETGDRSLFDGIEDGGYDIALPLMVRERVMLAVMAALKDKRNWEEKVFDPVIVSRWRSEALAASRIMLDIEKQNATAEPSEEEEEEEEEEEDKAKSIEFEIEHLNAPARQRVVTEKLFDYCIEELRSQAADSKVNGFTEVLDANAAVYISDTAISDETKSALKSGVAPLENVREDQKDWHPGSDGKVLDLVHPSLFPLMYGRSRYLSRTSVSLKGCVEHTGRGKRVPAINSVDTNDARTVYSAKHQWLPCEVRMKANGEAKITSYINNLLPDGNEGLYSAIEKVITASIPLWKKALRSTCFSYNTPRMVLQGDGFDHDAVPNAGDQEGISGQSGVTSAPENGDTSSSHSEDEDSGDETEGSNNQYFIKVPEPDTYEKRERSSTDKKAHKFDKSFPGKKLQVIVKLANIHLTPEKPSYNGGSWHVEGLQNEHICASALYYYDSNNVTDSHLGFREKVNGNFLAFNGIEREDQHPHWPSGPDYDQYEYAGIAEIYGLYDKTGYMPEVQILGQILTREDRLLVFPNVLQHRVSPFKLAEASRPGHRKLLALFLVDPNKKIPSTANIPPQRVDWWAQCINSKENTLFDKLPTEIKDQIFNEVRGFPVSLEQAKRVRKVLMKERGAQEVKTNRNWRRTEYFFCEH